jgi:succinate dehydrogenase hydrophobic anchor subunit
MRRPAMTAFVIWFAHFMLCWVAVEIWPSGSRANQLAWVFTAIALLAIGVHFARLLRQSVRSPLDQFSHRFARGAIAIATVAVLFTAIPSLVWLA